MIGKSVSKIYNENSYFSLQSPYAIAKVFVHPITQNYGNCYNNFACCGILFNHESPKDFINRSCNYLGLKIKWTGKGINERAINLNSKSTIIKINKNFLERQKCLPLTVMQEKQKKF